MLLVCLLLWIYFLPIYVSGEEFEPNVIWLKNNNIIYQPSKYKSSLNVYCYPGKKPKLKFLLSSAKARLQFNRKDKSNYLLFKGQNLSEIYKQYKEANANWYNLFPSWRPTKVNLEPFTLSCIGVSTKEDYSIVFNFFLIDYLKLTLLLGGVIINLIALKLSRNEFFYYAFGIAFGICASIMVLVYLLSRLVPRKSATAYLILASGWSFGLYILQYIWENAQLIMNLYSNYIAAYIVSVGLLSFCLCYYRGPPKNPRTLQIIKWAIQALSWLMIYFSCQNFPEASIMLIILTTFLSKFLPSQSKLNPMYLLRRRIQTYLYKKFPPRVKLLTQEEFSQQGIYETRKALNQLKDYCNNSQTTAWKYAKVLKDPKKFASFIEGDSSHVTQMELDEWESEDSSFRPQRKSFKTLTPSAPPRENARKSEAFTKIQERNNFYPTLNGSGRFKRKTIGDYLAEGSNSDSDEDLFALTPPPPVNAEITSRDSDASESLSLRDSEEPYSDIEI